MVDIGVKERTENCLDKAEDEDETERERKWEIRAYEEENVLQNGCLEKLKVKFMKQTRPLQQRNARY